MTEFHPLRPLEDYGESDNWKSLNLIAENRCNHTAIKDEPAIMPSMDHTTFQDYQNVYEPSDDTYLLIDGIKLDISSQLEQNKSKKQQEEDEDEEIKQSPPTPTAAALAVNTNYPVFHQVTAIATGDGWRRWRSAARTAPTATMDDYWVWWTRRYRLQ